MITIFLRFLDLNIEHRFRAYIFLVRYELFSQGPDLSIFLVSVKLKKNLKHFRQRSFLHPDQLEVGNCR